MDPHYKFKHRLVEGLILSRPNRFLMEVDLDGSIIEAHCPVTGRIGGLRFSDIPCLLSKSENSNRKTSHTVEAISLDPPGKKRKAWIGINQVRANRYIEFFLKQNLLPRMVKGDRLLREQGLGKSRIDFLIDSTYLEVKMPLINLPVPEAMGGAGHSKFDSFDRLIKHFTDLSNNLAGGSRAIVLLCYLYDAKPFSPPKPDKHNQKILRAARAAAKKGVENWQVNLSMNPRSLSLLRYFKLDLF